MSDRQALIAKIHIAKKAALVCSGCSRTYFGSYCPDCGSEEPQEYTDEEYRNTLAMLTGLTSCADMSDADLQLVGDYYDKAGFKEAHPYISPDAEHRRQRRAVMWH
ncbi:MAG: phage protein GemA/Gp16 family protein, partial [Sphaerochaetaceae bacterium]